MPPPLFFEHPSSLEHDTGSHPERIERIVAIEAELDRRGWLGYERVRSPAVERSVLGLVHSPAYVSEIARASVAGGGQLDPDTTLSEHSYLAALHACGGAVEMTRRLVREGAGAVGFSAHRPPGHHALPDRAMGFCLFNNIAVAARFATQELGLERVLILDWDVHHGNGTNDIFWTSREVLFISIHQWPLYPGSGGQREIGAGAGLGYTVNLPVPDGSGDAAFTSLVRDVAVPLARLYEPQLVLVSAGFDAHRDDPLAGCTVSDSGFAAMAAAMRDVCQELGIPLGCVLEGGYDLSALARSVAATMETIVTPANRPSEARDEPPHPLSTRARAELAENWPGLA